MQSSSHGIFKIRQGEIVTHLRVQGKLGTRHPALAYGAQASVPWLKRESKERFESRQEAAGVLFPGGHYSATYLWGGESQRLNWTACQTQLTSLARQYLGNGPSSKGPKMGKFGIRRALPPPASVSSTPGIAAFSSLLHRSTRWGKGKSQEWRWVE